MTDPAALPSRLSRAAGRTVFGSDVAGYHSARPGYPAALFRLIASRMPAYDSIAEIGPGTGIATEALAAFTPRRFVAFEPDPMLATHLRTRFALLDVIENDFCAANVDGPFDLIASASSFHWLDPDVALPKIRGLLGPGGCLAIWWNVYRQRGIGDRFAEAVTPLLADLDLPPSEGGESHYSLNFEWHRAQLQAAGFTDIEHHLFRRERTLSPAQARALYDSFSFVRLLPPERRSALLEAIERLVATEFDGAAPSVVLSPIYLSSAPRNS